MALVVLLQLAHGGGDLDAEGSRVCDQVVANLGQGGSREHLRGCRGGLDSLVGDVALTAYVPHNSPEGLAPGLEFSSFYDPANFTFPFGAHIAVVEVDTETGVVKLVRYAACDDVGNVVNPMIVDGQVCGGAAQGIGTAVYEEMPFDAQGQPLASTLADYLLPGATDIPNIRLLHMETPSPYTNFGQKGVGEGGAIGPAGAIANAINDALAPLGVEILQVPVTPRRIIEALERQRR